MKNEFLLRVSRILSELKKNHPAKLILSSSAQLNGWDGLPKENKNFFYLTGETLRGSLCCLSSSPDESVLMVPREDKTASLWLGPDKEPSRIANKINIRLQTCKDISADCNKWLLGCQTLFFDSSCDSIAQTVFKSQLNAPLRANGIRNFRPADRLFALQRLKKSPQEISAIKEAAMVTNSALFAALPIFFSGVAERVLRGAINFSFSVAGASEGFQTIVANGANAATLHYSTLNGHLKDGELTLFDLGASLNGYCADITRVLPVGGRFSQQQAAIYAIVLQAKNEATKLIRAGVKFSTIHDRAVEVISEGLRRLEVLKGTVKEIIKTGRYKQFFPHGIGHSLGIDVHDGWSLKEHEGQLESGMVLTIEPGLYFQKPANKIPRMGVRLEDDILVTKTGHVNLSKGFPIEIEEIEELLQRTPKIKK